MTRTEMNMLTERFAEVTGKQNDSVMNSARCAEYLGKITDILLLTRAEI